MFRTNFNEEQKLWSGKPCNLDFIRETSLGIEIVNSFEKYGPKVAQVEAVLLLFILYLICSKTKNIY